ncbi:DNA topoisomerase I, partial [Candidatus Woesearchaeota archaeon]|nr:DNA topoisomerase I [Candidatus Woesearchaeota archaeon]
MAYELIITEKPSSAQKIAQAIADGKATKKSTPQKVPYYELSAGGKDVKVVSAVGHLFSVAEKEKSFKYPSFDIEWKLAADVDKGAAFGRKYAMLIKKLAKDASEITVATDYDIEGETIGYTVVKYLTGRKDANRMKYSTVTAEDLQEAYANKQNHLDWGQVKAGETRHFLDWMYGINISRALMTSVKKAGRFMILSTGRVQGPALKIIVDKEKEIQAFVPEDYWQLELKAKKDKTEYSAWHKDDKIFDENKAKEINDKCQNKDAKVEKVDRREYKQAPPTPFDLGSLQTEAYRCFGIRPKETLEHAQNLYSAGYISYPRTSSQQLDPKLGFKKVLKGLAKQAQYKEHANIVAKGPLKPNNGKKKDPAHPAIYPTGYVPKSMKEREQKIYDLIVKRFFATFGEAALREGMTVTINCADEPFLAKGARTLKPNWHVFYMPYVNVKEESLPELVEGEDVDVQELIKHKKQTTPPNRYSQSSIITELEKRGLGTKATRADIVENLFKRGYAEGQSIQATDLGIKVSEALEEALPEIVDEQLTREFEEEMQQIREDKTTEEKVLERAKKELTKVLEKFKKDEERLGKILLDAHQEYEDEKNTIGPCPHCKKGTLMMKHARKGGSRFVGCDAYPDCEFTAPLPSMGYLSTTEEKCESCQWPLLQVKQARRAPSLLCINPECPKIVALEKKQEKFAHEAGEGKPCPKCGDGTLIIKKGRFGMFLGCDKYPKCKTIVNIPKSKEEQKVQEALEKQAEAAGSGKPCPKCGEGKLVLRKSARGAFLGCDKYPKCRTIVKIDVEKNEK